MDFPVWLPDDFAGKVNAFESKEKNNIYGFFDATQRGDMYHIRAWQILQKIRNPDNAAWHPPTIIHGYKPRKPETKGDNETVVEYITELIPPGTPLFVTTWSWADMTNEAQKPAVTDAKYNSHPISADKITWTLARQRQNPSEDKKAHGPSECTEDLQVWAARNSPTTLAPDLLKNMVKLCEADFAEHPTLLHDLDQALPSYFPVTQPKKPVALILWRNTSIAGGPYPELNTGIDSARQIIGILNNLNIIPAFIDVSEAEVATIRGLGAHCSDHPYFKYSTAGWPTSSVRDHEAFWMQRAFAKNHFQMAIGARSGALDLLTFLGVPTVSLVSLLLLSECLTNMPQGLQDMIGEGRMHKLGGQNFKRVNIDYVVPRHSHTALVKSGKGSDLVFKSPIAVGDVDPIGYDGQPTTIPAQETMRGFSAFDLRSVELAIRLMAKNYAKLDILYGIVSGNNNPWLVAAENTRAFYVPAEARGGVKPDLILPIVRAAKVSEEVDFQWRQNHQAEIREPSDRRRKAATEMEAQYAQLVARLEQIAKGQAGKGQSNKM
ncbi:hypothetical protein MRB53_040275 [Persea americana]|nr:hypothetical protein MRB53_040275 [Persea americana]